MRKPGTFVLFWDYDTQWGADRSRAGDGPRQYGHLEFENTERLLDLHAQFNVPACFAVVGAAALPGARPYHDPAQIRRIHQAGHEVASHSFQHDWLPGLGDEALRETLTHSKDALENCIGERVVSFVPPWNQPVDYSARLSISLSERRQAGNKRTTVPRLCRALAECGYRNCRIAYRPIHRRLIDFVARRRIDTPLQPTIIERILALRLNTPGGFAKDTQGMVIRCVASGNLAVAYGHPHSITSNGPQSESNLTTLLALVSRLRKEGSLRVTLPREIVVSNQALLRKLLAT